MVTCSDFLSVLNFRNEEYSTAVSLQLVATCGRDRAIAATRFMRLTHAMRHFAEFRGIITDRHYLASTRSGVWSG